jgi:hypothetical protein
MVENIFSCPSRRGYCRRKSIWLADKPGLNDTLRRRVLIKVFDKQFDRRSLMIGIRRWFQLYGHCQWTLNICRRWVEEEDGGGGGGGDVNNGLVDPENYPIRLSAGNGVRAK